ncbi:MAG: Glu/Leu/Phe/Val dehydrogenase dimerization domain-containing protein [Pseudomonadota bacterium]
MFHHRAFDGHETVVHVADAASGLRAIIAVHNTARGPSLGGVRVWRYGDDDAALTDALRLSRGMTYKAAMADLPTGGGKAVVCLAPGAQKTTAMFEALGRAIEGLSGRYIAAEDVGTAPADMKAISQNTRHVTGLAPEDGGEGDPSPTTADGCFVAVKATAARLEKPLEGLHVAVQGLGNVGFGLGERLVAAGARLTVTDINPERIALAQSTLGAEAVAPGAIFDVAADIFSPNALGGALSADTIPRLRVSGIAGGANNQLATDEDAARLTQRGILYAPDYVVNGGGVTAMVRTYFGWSEADVTRRVAAIADRLHEIFARAEADGATTAAVADAMARARL